MSNIFSIPYGKQHITQDDINAVVDVLKSDFLTQGPQIQIFERAFAEYIGCKYAVAVSNGTAALHLCTLALNVSKGDMVITTPLTFAASANCIKYAGGDVVFSDIDSETYLLDIDKVEELLKNDLNNNIKGIIPVDFAGRAIDMAKLKSIAEKYNCWIIEDACHAPGGYFFDSDNTKHLCGNCDNSELAIFSFHPVKHIASGEGGMITTNNEALYKRLLTLRTHGITKRPEELVENHGGWYYELQELGYNYRLSDMQAALGNSQLKRADEGLIRRREIAKMYFESFRDKPFVKGQSGVIEGHAYHLYVIEVNNRDELYNYLHKKNIYAQIHYVPLHLMPYYKQFGWKKGDFPKVERYYENCISLPMYPSLTEEEQEYVITTILAFYE